MGLRPSYGLTDRVYDANPLRRVIVEQGGEPVIPGCRCRAVRIDHDRERNIVERGIGCARQCRRLAKHLEKIASSYPGFVMFVAVRHWLQHPIVHMH